jgi:hypothetical protein
MGRILRIAKPEVARLKLDSDVWQWLRNWPPAVEPMPSNEPGATEAESIASWNHYMIEHPDLIPNECARGDDATWSYACVWKTIRDAVLDGRVEVVPGQDHTHGKPFEESFMQCDGSCRTIPTPTKWRVWKYGENYQERYRYVR